ncbi:LPXTG cell wall anchor domain-containing protein [Dolosicoccus paucivorans]|uniref:LPXTG cell wall anchor domain-containing protein n=1 Tax=Dolosicoccus paucivorans TaxID=84521 RepID=UPI00087E3D9E|nr:LPXTG cell wall anchor domain-containing protein [Dolosicoccus paucivorans]SDI59777.1 LPXTG-motif cell wall anchor domain-containing protein [Dolosicoccus paucivorans]
MKKSLIKPLFLTSAILSGVVAANITYAPVAQVDNVAVAETETVEEEYYVSYQVRNEAGEVINVLQSETWNDWAAMEEASVVVANQFGEELGFGSYAFNVEATADGLTYYFVQEDEKETEYTVVYEVRDEEGHVLEVLQTETWTDWDAMEEASVVVANQFGKDLGFGEFKFNVDATPEGLTYYFVDGEQEDASSEEDEVESTDENSSQESSQEQTETDETEASKGESSESKSSKEESESEESSSEESESKKPVPGKKKPGKPGKMLPNTGDRSFFGAAALSFLAGFGLMAVRKSKKDA